MKELNLRHVNEIKIKELKTYQAHMALQVFMKNIIVFDKKQ